MKIKLIVILGFILIASCKNDDNDIVTEQTDPPNILGMDYSKSMVSFEETFGTLSNALRCKPEYWSSSRCRSFCETQHL